MPVSLPECAWFICARRVNKEQRTGFVFINGLPDEVSAALVDVRPRPVHQGLVGAAPWPIVTKIKTPETMAVARSLE